MSDEGLEALEERLGYRFRDRAHLSAALRHASAAEVAGPRTNERLEFLGDAVLGLALSDLLIERYPASNEGQLSKYRATLVKTTSFARKARELGLNEHLTLGRGEERTGGREKSSILAAAYEAVMGAIFLESGYAQVKSIVICHFGEAIDGVGQLETMDAKTELQERLQATHHTTPTYRVVREEGPDHARWFVVEVLLGAEVLASGEGGSKRSAEQAAARQALERTRELALP